MNNGQNQLTDDQRRQIKELRRRIHMHPELGNEEHETAALIEESLSALGVETVRMLDTAVIGKLRGSKPGRTVALRADMDALPVSEATGCEFSSQIPGLMHACGHDVHTAALIGAAGILAGKREELCGNVLFIFQPDEEGRGGAARLMDSGCLDGADVIFGAHVSPDLEEGHIGIRYGKFYAASDVFTVRVTGKSSHAAVREEGIDALAAACEMVTGLLGIPEQITSEKCVLTVGTIHSGTAENIMPGFAEFRGIVRTLGPDTRSAMEHAFRECVDHIAEITNTRVDITYTHNYPGIVNDDAASDHVLGSARRLCGWDMVHIIGEPTMTTEDFGEYLKKIPGAYFHIGAGSDMPLHNPRFLPVEEVTCRLAEVLAGITEDYLK